MEEIKNASITVEKDGYTEENMMFVYSDEEMERNEINSENAKLVFSPEFIPFYRDIQEKFQLTDKQTLIYGFIRFYKIKCSGRFYFTDKQLGQVVGCHEQTAQEAISVLKKKGLIECGHKIKAGGGTIRFIKRVLLPIVQNIPSTMVENIPTNKNKINKNKINNILKDTNIPLKEYSLFLQRFNTILSTRYRGSDKVKRQFNARLREGYTLDEILKAVENASKDEFLMGKNENHKKYLTPEYILRANILDKWLNAPIEGEGVKRAKL